MKTTNLTTIALSALLALAACGDKDGDTKNDSSTTTSSTKKETGGDNEALIPNAKAPEGITFQRIDIGGASFEMPTGSGWTRDGEKIHNEAWDMTIVVQSQAEGMLDVKKDYLESYNDNNIRDAENWKRGATKYGKVAGIDGAQLMGDFNNGNPYVVRDYAYFDKNKTTILQARIAEKNKEKLAPVVDYIATTYR